MEKALHAGIDRAAINHGRSVRELGLMRQLSPFGQDAINDIAERHGFSAAAVLSMLDAVINGNGGMAQFSHPEFAGSGQWMRGGMTMVSDMFNNRLKDRVNALCSELAILVSSQPDLLRNGSFQSQSQASHRSRQAQTNSSSPDRPAGSAGAASLFVAPAPGTSEDWWPAGLGFPNSTGAQDGVRYAYFSQAGRLAIEDDGRVTLYDTRGHDIGGFSQQQSVGGTLSFTSQHGLISLASLPVISTTGEVPSRAHHAPASGLRGSSTSQGQDIFGAIEQLASLKAKGILTEDEFSTKKAELLSRI